MLLRERYRVTSADTVVGQLTLIRNTGLVRTYIIKCMYVPVNLTLASGLLSLPPY